MHLSPAIRLASLTSLLLATIFALTACSGTISLKPLMSKVLIMPYSDFGPAEFAQPLLGPENLRAQIVVHYAQSQDALVKQYPSQPGVADYRYAAIVPALRHLNHSISALPHDQAHAATYARLTTTRERLMNFYSTRRIAYNSVPPYVGRGFIIRQAMVPAIGTTTWKVEP